MTIDKAYEVFKLNKNSSLDEIKAKYRELSKKYHPDFFSNNEVANEMATEKFREIKEAYEILKLNYSKKENFNETFEESSKKEEINFKWNNYTVTIEKELIKYNLIRREIQFSLYEVSARYEDIYRSYGNLDDFINQDEEKAIKIISKTFEYLVSISIKNGYDILSAKILINKYLTLVLKDYFSHLNSLKEKIRDLEMSYEVNKEYKEYRDILKGKNDFWGKAIRGIENFGEECKIFEIKNQIYKNSNTINTFKNDIVKGILECVEIVTQVLGLTKKINYLLSESILDNIYNYSEDQREKKLLEAFFYNPYNEKVYINILNLLGDKSNDAEKIAEYFGMKIVKLEKDKIILKYKKEFEEDIHIDIEKAKIKFIEKLKYFGINYESFNEYMEECIVKNYKIEFEKEIKINIEKAISNFKNNIISLNLDFEKYKGYINNKLVSIYKAEFEEVAKIDIVKAKEIFKKKIEDLNLDYNNYISYEKSIEKRIELEKEEKKLKIENKKSIKGLLKVWLVFVFFLSIISFFRGRSAGIIDSLVSGIVLASIPYGLPILAIAFILNTKEKIKIKQNIGCLSILILFIVIMSYLIFSKK